MNAQLGPRRAQTAGAARRFLLLYHPDQDWRYADDLTQMLRGRGAEVFPPDDPCPDPFLNLPAYEDALRQSAGVVLCQGRAPDEWLDGVDRKLSVLRMRDKQIGQVISDACSRLPRNLTRKEWRIYVHDEPYRATCPNLPPEPPPVADAR